MLVISIQNTVFASLTESEVQAIVESQGKDAVSGNIFVWFLCAVAFLKISQKIDSFLSGLGLNVGHTGGNLMAEVMIAARTLGTGGKLLGGAKGFSNTASAVGDASKTSPFSGGLAGVVGRKMNNSAMNAATDKSSSGISGSISKGIGKMAFESSLNKDGSFAKDVIGNIATGNVSQNGSITGDLAERALSSYLGYEAGGGSIDTGNESLNALSQSSDNFDMASTSESLPYESTSEAGDMSISGTATEMGASSVIMEASSSDTDYASNEDYASSSDYTSAISGDHSEGIETIPTTDGYAETAYSGGGIAESLIATSISSSTETSDSGDSHNQDAHAGDTLSPEGTYTPQIGLGSESVSMPDANAISTGSDNMVSQSSSAHVSQSNTAINTTESTSQSSPSTSNTVDAGLSVEQSSFVQSSDNTNSTATTNQNESFTGNMMVQNTEQLDNIENMQDMYGDYLLNGNTQLPAFSNVEIGGGRITGVEQNKEFPNGIEFGMYNTKQYMKPDGKFSIVETVDGAKWYKQYAADTVEKTPKVGEEGKISYDEKIVKKLPHIPKRKDRI